MLCYPLLLEVVLALVCSFAFIAIRKLGLKDLDEKQPPPSTNPTT